MFVLYTALLSVINIFIIGIKLEPVYIGNVENKKYNKLTIW